MTGPRRARPGQSPYPKRPLRDGDSETVRIWGLHAVEAVLANAHRDVIALQLTENAEHRLAGPIAARGVTPERLAPRDLDRLLGADVVHQGALVETRLLDEPSLAELIEMAARAGPLVVLDQVTDPHNVGAILRSAAVLGASGLVMTRRHSPPLGGALAKAASGALEAVPVALVVNLARALAEMGEAGVHRIGLDGEAPALIGDARLSGPVALVFGSEGSGLRRLTREHCDGLCRVGAAGPLASLNVSNAAAVALYAASLTRHP